MRRTLLLTLPVLLAAGLSVACGSDDDADTTLGRMDQRADDHMDRRADDHMGGTVGDHGMAPDHPRPRRVAPGARRIEITASSYRFDPDEIHVRAGEEVAIVLTSTDALHDISVDGIDAHVSAEAGRTATGGLRADEPGRYPFSCTVAGHREAGMRGELVVEG